MQPAIISPPEYSPSTEAELTGVSTVLQLAFFGFHPDMPGLGQRPTQQERASPRRSRKPQTINDGAGGQRQACLGLWAGRSAGQRKPRMTGVLTASAVQASPLPPPRSSSPSPVHLRRTLGGFMMEPATLDAPRSCTLGPHPRIRIPASQPCFRAQPARRVLGSPFRSRAIHHVWISPGSGLVDSSAA